MHTLGVVECVVREKRRDHVLVQELRAFGRARVASAAAEQPEHRAVVRVGTQHDRQQLAALGPGAGVRAVHDVEHHGAPRGLREARDRHRVVRAEPVDQPARGAALRVVVAGDRAGDQAQDRELAEIAVLLASSHAAASRPRAAAAVSSGASRFTISRRVATGSAQSDCCARRPAAPASAITLTYVSKGSGTNARRGGMVVGRSIRGEARVRNRRQSRSANSRRNFFS
ncbi:MAG TPA: hypothetical protein VF384_15425 [Planctomycetota bacterium]